MQKVKANGHDMRPLTESTQMPFDVALSNSDGNYTPAGTERGISLYFHLHSPFSNLKVCATEISRK